MVRPAALPEVIPVLQANVNRAESETEEDVLYDISEEEVLQEGRPQHHRRHVHQVTYYVPGVQAEYPD